MRWRIDATPSESQTSRSQSVSQTCHHSNICHTTPRLFKKMLINLRPHRTPRKWNSYSVHETRHPPACNLSRCSLPSTFASRLPIGTSFAMPRNNYCCSEQRTAAVIASSERDIHDQLLPVPDLPCVYGVEPPPCTLRPVPRMPRWYQRRRSRLELLALGISRSMAPRRT